MAPMQEHALAYSITLQELAYMGMGGPAIL
jgi:hypothetical protein